MLGNAISAIKAYFSYEPVTSVNSLTVGSQKFTKEQLSPTALELAKTSGTALKQLERNERASFAFWSTLGAGNALYKAGQAAYGLWNGTCTLASYANPWTALAVATTIGAPIVAHKVTKVVAGIYAEGIRGPIRSQLEARIEAAKQKQKEQAQVQARQFATARVIQSQTEHAKVS